ncbi:MAG: UDP-N-acetylmuramate:L-alanyl-gamma-D-glutamyl-meso-diaminopimelate ligase, partial [Betaproteobacteria bacterium]
NVYPPMSTQLEAQGIKLVEGFGVEQLDLQPDVYVIGNVVARGNALMEEILNRGSPYISGPQWLAENVLRGRWVLAVAGTHGKTTTTAMLAWILEHAGLNPGFLIGGVPGNFNISARLPGFPPIPAFPHQGGRRNGGAANESDSFFVIEADEYDTAFFDKRSKFVHYAPRTAVFNNLEYDHADIFPDLAAIEAQFHHLVRTVPGAGLIVSNGADANLERVLARGAWTPVERFAVAAGWQAGAQSADGRFTVSFNGKPVGEVQWDLLGVHNQLNALAALAAARHAGVAPAVAIEALAAFENVKRRLELRGTVDGISVYDDFAHHPTAIRTTLAGLRAKTSQLSHPTRVLAVLEPRSNTMKLGVMKDALAGSLAAADRVYCYGGGLGWDPTPALAPLGARAEIHQDIARLVAAIAHEAKAGDHVLIMSNGGFGGIHDKLLHQLGKGHG